jgi:hypothetical protein
MLPVGLNMPGGTLIVVPFTEPVLLPVALGPANVVPGGTLIILPGGGVPVLFPGGIGAFSVVMMA